MKLSLVYYGNPILRKKALPVEAITDETRELVLAMDKVMQENNGAGLAAPQVGKSLRLFIMRVEEELPEEEEDESDLDEKNSSKKPAPVLGKLQVFINPKISHPGDNLVDFNEGCLSIPKIRADVLRPDTIHVEAIDLEGNPINKRFEGLEARVIMHENDHLNGVFFIDRLSKKERDALEPALRKIKQKFH